MGTYDNPPLLSAAPADGQTMRFNAATGKWDPVTSGGGGVASVVSGTDISVNSADPANPIVNFNRALITVTELDVAFNLAGLNAGVTILSPNPGDLVFDVWVELHTAFDGTTPKLDVGTTRNPVGFFQSLGNGPLDLTAAVDNDELQTLLISDYLRSGTGSSFSDLNAIAGRRIVPAAWANNVSDFSVWVSQDGNGGSAAPGSTTGLARVYVFQYPGFA